MIMEEGLAKTGKAAEEARTDEESGTESESDDSEAQDSIQRHSQILCLTRM